MSKMQRPKPFKISVSEELLSFIEQRVATARILPELNLPADKAWSNGIPSSRISYLRDYWEKKYDWRAVEAKINSHLKMYTLPINEAGQDLIIHFVHHRSEREDAIPLLFQHGWPGNFLEVDKIIDSLTNPDEPGKQAYHVVAPSLPGFVFSEGPNGADFDIGNFASVDHKLMQALGYEKYMAQGGDWGSMISRIIALNYPESCVAVHVNMIASTPPIWWRSPLTLIYFICWAIWQGKGKDDGMLGRMMWWMSEESGYFEIQGTKPQTLNYGLMDSPIGMLAWLCEKMETLVDDDFTWTPEEVITWAMLYLINGTSGHASIYTNAKGTKLKSFESSFIKRVLSSNVDFGASIFPKEIFNTPKWWADVSVAKNIVFYKTHDKGGHFPSIERPVVLVEDIREFTKAINPSRMAELVKVGKLKV